MGKNSPRIEWCSLSLNIQIDSLNNKNLKQHQNTINFYELLEMRALVVLYLVLALFVNGSLL